MLTRDSLSALKILPRVNLFIILGLDSAGSDGCFRPSGSTLPISFQSMTHETARPLLPVSHTAYITFPQEAARCIFTMEHTGRWEGKISTLGYKTLQQAQLPQSGDRNTNWKVSVNCEQWTMQSASQSEAFIDTCFSSVKRHFRSEAPRSVDIHRFPVKYSTQIYVGFSNQNPQHSMQPLFFTGSNWREASIRPTGTAEIYTDDIYRS